MKKLEKWMFSKVVKSWNFEKNTKKFFEKDRFLRTENALKAVKILHLQVNIQVLLVTIKIGTNSSEGNFCTDSCRRRFEGFQGSN